LLIGYPSVFLRRPIMRKQATCPLLDDDKHEQIAVLMAMEEDDVLREIFSEEVLSEWEHHRQTCIQCEQRLIEYRILCLVLSEWGSNARRFAAVKSEGGRQ
jgi:hypothetical protein